MLAIIINEWKSFLRAKTFLYLNLFLVTCLIAVTWLGVIQNQQQKKQQEAATKHIRQQWENLKPMNPHGAAHYGSYAFKPVTVLSSMDDGVNAITGNVLRLEGHVQNEAAYAEASQSLSASKFGKLKPALLLQFVIPLLLIFLAFTSVSKEKDSGRLKLLLLQGAPLSRVIMAKNISIWLYGLALLLLTFLIQLLTNLSGLSTDILWRSTFLLLSYSAYYYILTTITVYLSAYLKTNTAALSGMIAIWMIWTIFLPKIWGNTVEKISPLQSRQEFKTAMTEDRSKGINGHNPRDKRADELKKKVLARYKVDSVSQLPVNFDGLRMQADEEYGNMVWDKHFGKQYKTLKEQKTNYQYSGIINPFISLQGASMGFSETDMLHYVDFQLQAEKYRRVFIKALNDGMTYGSKTGDWDWKVDSRFYKSVQNFKYQSPSLNQALKYYTMDLLGLVFWVTFTTLLVTIGSKRINIKL